MTKNIDFSYDEGTTTNPAHDVQSIMTKISTLAREKLSQARKPPSVSEADWETRVNSIVEQCSQEGSRAKLESFKTVAPWDQWKMRTANSANSATDYQLRFDIEVSTEAGESTSWTMFSSREG